MSYLVFNEGWKNWVHTFNKGGVFGGNSSLSDIKKFRGLNWSFNKFMDEKFFNHLFKLDKINDIVYPLCSKLAKPINSNKEKIIDKKNITSIFNYNRNNHLDEKSIKFSTIKKIYDEKHENFYLVRFTFDDSKIYEADVIVPMINDNVRILNIKQWNTIKPEEYLD